MDLGGINDQVVLDHDVGSESEAPCRLGVTGIGQKTFDGLKELVTV